MVVVLSEALADRGIAVTVATRLERARVRAGSCINRSARRGRVTLTSPSWSSGGVTRRLEAGPVRVFLATDVHVPDPAMFARCLEWSTHSLALIAVHARTDPSGGSRYGYGDSVAAARARRLHGERAHARDPVMLYCSVPDRGLYYLKDLFPAIRKRVPAATLVITSDFTLWGRASAKVAFMRFFEHQHGIEYLGHVGRSQLIAEQHRARVLAYPCTFEEGFCIAAAECMAAGAVPVTTNAFALTTTVGDAGVLIDGRPRSWFYRRRFVKAAAALLTDDREWRAAIPGVPSTC